MYILSVDTTAKTASAAVSVVKDEKVYPLCDARLNSTLTHSESILPMIEFCYVCILMSKKVKSNHGDIKRLV